MNTRSYALFFCKSGRSHDVLPRAFVCYALDGRGCGDESMTQDGEWWCACESVDVEEGAGYYAFCFCAFPVVL
jgi:hypothetical protein